MKGILRCQKLSLVKYVRLCDLLINLFGGGVRVLFNKAAVADIFEILLLLEGSSDVSDPRLETHIVLLLDAPAQSLSGWVKLSEEGDFWVGCWFCSVFSGWFGRWAWLLFMRVCLEVELVIAHDSVVQVA